MRTRQLCSNALGKVGVLRSKVLRKSTALWIKVRQTYQTATSDIITGAGVLRSKVLRKSTALWTKVKQTYQTTTSDIVAGASDLKTAYLRGTQLSKATPSKQDELPDILVMFALPAFVSGLLYITIFAPLTVSEVIRAGDDLTGILLLQTTPKCLSPAFFDSVFPRFSSPCARPLVFSFGFLYGAIGIVSGLLIITAGFPKVLITANGIVLGFYMTAFLGVHVFSFLPASALVGVLLPLKIAYLMLAYYVSLAVPRLLGGRGYQKEKYESLCSGLFGMASGFILAKGFGSNAVMFSGSLFLCCAFLGMSFYEKLLVPVFWTLRAMMGERYWGYFDLERGYSISTIRAGIHLFTREARALILMGCLVMTVFPLLVALLYYFLLEGRA